MAPPPLARPVAVGGLMLNEIFEAASDGDLPRFKLLVMLLDMGRGRLREAVEALRVEDEGLMKGLSALHVAAIRGRLEVCRYLVEDLGVDVNVADEYGRTPLFFTTLSENVGTAEYLLGHGANQDKSCHDGISPLHQATVSGDCDMVELLLAKGAYVDPEAHYGTPLHVAAMKDHDGAMKILLNHNADVNRMVNGKTPMITAIDAVSKKCLRLLYKAGADRKGALAYSLENLCAAKVVSSDFVKCAMEDLDNNCIRRGEPVVKRKTRKGGLKAVADYAFKEKEYETAGLYYSVIIALDPDDAIVFSNRSLCWLLMGDGGKALLDALMNVGKGSLTGQKLVSVKDYQKACERFSDGLKLDPGNTEMEDALRKASESLQLSGSAKPE